MAHVLTQRTFSRAWLAAAFAIVPAMGCSDDGSERTTTPTTAVTVTNTLPPMTATTTVDTTVTTGTTLPPATRTNPGVLEVLDGDIPLPPGKYIDAFRIRNAGGEAMLWTAVGVPDTIILNRRSGTLGPGEEVNVLVTVKPESLATGPFTLRFHISANDTAKPVTVRGAKP